MFFVVTILRKDSLFDSKRGHFLPSYSSRAFGIIVFKTKQNSDTQRLILETDHTHLYELALPVLMLSFYFQKVDDELYQKYNLHRAQYPFPH